MDLNTSVKCLFEDIFKTFPVIGSGTIPVQTLGGESKIIFSRGFGGCTLYQYRNRTIVSHIKSDNLMNLPSDRNLRYDHIKLFYLDGVCTIQYHCEQFMHTITCTRDEAQSEAEFELMIHNVDKCAIAIAMFLCYSAEGLSQADYLEVRCDLISKMLG